MARIGGVKGVLSAAICLAILAGPSRADQIILKNGDKLNGTVGLISGGSMSFTSPVLGVLTIKLTDLQSYTTTEPATVRLTTGQIITAPIIQGSSTQIQTGANQITPTEQVKDVNPPAEAWTGSIVLNGALNRGNTYSDTLGLSALAILRRDSLLADDKTTFGTDYNLGNTGRGHNAVTTTDNFDAMVEYDKYITEKFYGYGDVGYLHDRIANLQVQLTPGVGVGYQWFEQPDFHFNTEGGISYLYQDFSDSGVQQETAFRLAYHVDKQINDQVTLFNDAEYLAAFSDPADYIITADAGIQADLTTNFFSQFKVQYRRADHPATGALKDDLAFLLGVGWKF